MALAIKENDDDDDEILNTNWIVQFKEEERNYNDFYKEPVKKIKIFLLYVNRNNEIEHVYNDKCELSENSILKREIIVNFIKEYQLIYAIHYKLLSLLKYNINLDINEINDFLIEDIDSNRFITSEKYLNDIHFEDTIQMFQDLNSLFFVFYEEKNKMNQTKRIIFSHSAQHKTKRNRQNDRHNEKYKKT